MAKKSLQEVLTQDTVTLKDKYLQVRTEQDGYTRTHRGIYSYICKEQDGELFLFPIQLDGRGTINVMKDSPVVYTDGDNIHFVVNTLFDPYHQSFIRTENIKGLDKGKQLVQAFLAFIEDRFRLGVYNVFITNEKEDVLEVKDVEQSDADKTEDKKSRANEDLISSYPTGNAREDVRHNDQSEGQGDTSEPSESRSDVDVDVSVDPKDTTADVNAEEKPQ